MSRTISLGSRSLSRGNSGATVFRDKADRVLKKINSPKKRKRRKLDAEAQEKVRKKMKKGKEKKQREMERALNLKLSTGEDDLSVVDGIFKTLSPEEKKRSEVGELAVAIMKMKMTFAIAPPDAHAIRETDDDQVEIIKRKMVKSRLTVVGGIQIGLMKLKDNVRSYDYDHKNINNYEEKITPTQLAHVLKVLPTDLPMKKQTGPEGDARIEQLIAEGYRFVTWGGNHSRTAVEELAEEKGKEWVAKIAHQTMIIHVNATPEQAKFIAVEDNRVYALFFTFYNVQEESESKHDCSIFTNFKKICMCSKT